MLTQKFWEFFFCSLHFKWLFEFLKIFAFLLKEGSSIAKKTKQKKKKTSKSRNLSIDFTEGTVKLKTFLQMTHFVLVIKVWGRLCSYKKYQNIVVWKSFLEIPLLVKVLSAKIQLFSALCDTRKILCRVALKYVYFQNISGDKCTNY